MKNIRGCLVDFKVPYSIRGIGIDEADLVRCPRKYSGGNTLVMVAAYREYEKGFLPNSGGWLDQPAKFTASMTIIDAAIVRMEEREKPNG